MIYPKKNILFKSILDTYVRWLTARHFHQINYNHIDTAQDRSVLLIANHFSAWDTFVLYHINRKLLRKRFHVMILAETLKKRSMLKYGGAFSINKNSRDMLATLNFAAKLLEDPQNLVLIFPQGRLYSNMVSEIVFEKGVMQVLKKAAGKFNLVLAASFIENFENFKTVANVQLKVEGNQSFSTIDELRDAYQQHYAAARQQQIQIIR